jgi:hypothetical protein
MTNFLVSIYGSPDGGLIIAHDIMPFSTERGDLIFIGKRTKIMLTLYAGSRAYMQTIGEVKPVDHFGKKHERIL